MNYLLDTCVLSEFTRRKPAEKVIAWMDSVDESRLFLSVITVGEIQHRVERIPPGERKTQILEWLNNRLLPRFDARILPLDTATLRLWGALVARLENVGQPMPVMDALIAATALQHNLILVTRNMADFERSAVQLLNPWDET